MTTENDQNTDDVDDEPNAEPTVEALEGVDTSDPRYQLASKLREEGTKVKDICRVCGISMTTYYGWFPRPESAQVREFQLKQAREMAELRKTMSDAEIAREFKTTRQRIWVLLGPRGRTQIQKKVPVTWRATPEMIHNVEKVARHAGAAFDEGNVTIQTMLDMIATGRLIVTAPKRTRRGSEPTNR